jgi:glycosyltransferase involved in cell wall biosynthesis
MSPPIDISVVIPLLNEEENLPILYRELVAALEPMGRTFELLFIDDGSTDTSLTILKALQADDANVVVVSFRRNFGQTAGLAAGFDFARGGIIITMDADLQNDPADIPKLVSELDRGYDLACGWRHNRQDAFLNRRLPSILANKVISATTNVKLHDYGCTLKAFRSEVIKTIKLYGEMHRFIPAIASGYGFRSTEVKVNHRARRFGQSKYGISRTIRVVLDLLTVKFLLSYATRPIQIFGLIGFVSGSLGFLMALYLSIQRLFFSVPLGNRPALLLAILLIFIGLQFVTLGLLAEVQSRTYHETQDKPVYMVKEIVGQDRPAD